MSAPRTHFFRPLRAIDAHKVKDVEPERAIRLYCEQCASLWNLQLRTPLARADRRDSSAFVVVTARLGIDDMLALRAAIDAMLVEGDIPLPEPPAVVAGRVKEGA